MAVDSTCSSTDNLIPQLSDGDTVNDLSKQPQRCDGNGQDGKGSKSARESLEETNFSPQKPENSATINFQVFGFGDFYTNHPFNPKKVDTPFSVLYTIVDKNLVTLGDPSPGSGIPFFVTIPTYKHGVQVGGTITGTTPGGFAVITPGGYVVPKPFAVAYFDLDGNVGAITGIWSVNEFLGSSGFTLGARIIANANIAGFKDEYYLKPGNLDALAPGGSVDKTYMNLQAYDQHQTLSALGINSLADYKKAIESYSNDGGFNLPLDISGLAWSPEGQASSVDAVNWQVGIHLLDRMRIVNDFDGSQTAAHSQIELDQVNQQIDEIKTGLESLAGNTSPEYSGDIAFYEGQLEELNARQQILENTIKDLPAKFSHDIYSPEKVRDILANQSRDEEQVILKFEDKIKATEQQLNDLKLTLAKTMDRDEIRAIEQKIPALETQIKVLEEQRTLLTASWRPDTGSEAYAATQALTATNDKIDSIEKTLTEMSKPPIGMPPNEWQQKANFELEKALLADLTTLHNDKKKLEGWLQANTPIPVARQEPPPEKMSSTPIPTSKPLDVNPTHLPSPPRPQAADQAAVDSGADVIPTHLPSPPRPDVTGRTAVDSSAIDPLSEPAIDYAQTFANDLHSWGQGFVDLGSAVKSHYQTQVSQQKEHYSKSQQRDFEMFGRAGESLHDFTQRTK